ncbi:MAG: YncE family protein [Mycobacteriaceae bacterium]|nr:YncE family protein [Mycobacteriaceae bacterium]
MNVAKNVTPMGPLASAPDDVLRDARADAEFTELGKLAVGGGPIGELTVAASAVIVSSYSDNAVAVIDADGLTVRAVVALGGEPVATAAADSRVYVGTTSASHDSVSVVDAQTGTIAATYPVDLGITAVAVSRDGRRIFAGRSGRGRADIAILDTAAGAVGAIDVAATPGVVVDTVRLSPEGRRLYAAVSDAHSSDLRVFDADAAGLIATVPIGSPIRDLAVSPDGGTAYVLVSHPRSGGLIDVVDTRANRVKTTIAIGGVPMQMTLNADGTRAYVVDRDDVLVICTVTQQIVATVRVGGPASSVAASPHGGRLYVADYCGAVTMVGVAPAKTVPLFGAIARELPRGAGVRELQPAV